MQRSGWETRMFGDVYNSGSAFERPKYGCLNTTLDNQGCLAAAAYGECYFVLSDMTCRWRTTLTNKDSCHADSIIGILSHCCHVLRKFDTNDLMDLIKVANYNPQSKTTTTTTNDKDKEKGTENSNTTAASTTNTITNSSGRAKQYYREIQIHGPVRTDVDIEELWIPMKYINDQGIQKFVKKNNIELKIIGT